MLTSSWISITDGITGNDVDVLDELQGLPLVASALNNRSTFKGYVFNPFSYSPVGFGSSFTRQRSPRIIPRIL